MAFCEQAVTCCSLFDVKISVNPRKCFWQAVKDSDELRKAVEEVQPLRVKLSLRLAQSRPLCALAWPSLTGDSSSVLTRGHACSLCAALDCKLSQRLAEPYTVRSCLGQPSCPYVPYLVMAGLEL